MYFNNRFFKFLLPVFLSFLIIFNFLIVDTVVYAEVITSTIALKVVASVLAGCGIILAKKSDYESFFNTYLSDYKSKTDSIKNLAINYLKYRTYNSYEKLKSTISNAVNSITSTNNIKVSSQNNKVLNEVFIGNSLPYNLVDVSMYSGNPSTIEFSLKSGENLLLLGNSAFIFVENSQGQFYGRTFNLHDHSQGYDFCNIATKKVMLSRDKDFPHLYNIYQVYSDDTISKVDGMISFDGRIEEYKNSLPLLYNNSINLYSYRADNSYVESGLTFGSNVWGDTADEVIESLGYNFSDSYLRDLEYTALNPGISVGTILTGNPVVGYEAVVDAQSNTDEYELEGIEGSPLNTDELEGDVSSDLPVVGFLGKILEILKKILEGLLSIPSILKDILTGLLSIPSYISNVASKLDILESIKNLISTLSKPIAIPLELIFGVPDDLSLDLDSLKINTVIKDKFPFCLPFDLYNVIKLFSISPSNPNFDINISTSFFKINHEIDLTSIYLPITFFRYVVTAFFVFFLISKTKDFISW